METVARMKLRGARALALVLVLTLASLAAAGVAPAAAKDRPAVPAKLLQSAEDHPGATFRVIVQAAAAATAADAAADVAKVSRGLQRRLESIRGTAVAVTGEQLVRLAAVTDFSAITQDTPVTLSGFGNKQAWALAVRAQTLWGAAASDELEPTAIAIVDTGVDRSRPDLRGRVVKSVDLATSTPNSARDGNGHGTFVAGIAAGAAAGYAGTAPTAPIVDVDVADDNGRAYTSDVVAAADWILANKDKYEIGVANFSLQGSVPASIRFDPIDQAVERLWLAGVVVVAAAGNDRSGSTPNGVQYAPANDPFVITVGALDVNGTISAADDVAAPWSSYGSTPDGFRKPDLAAPGRGLIGPVPPRSALPGERPTAVVANGYMQLSGTSFSAPAVSGVAAMLLAQHPDWTPDQVKGALMVSAQPLPAALGDSVGAGELDATAAWAVTAPPNPNAVLNRFVVPRSDGSGTVFDQAAWTSAAAASPAWASASWTSASWTSASWTSASWTSASWTSASWTSASWTTRSWVQ
jgi:serine protease AprX